MTVPRMGIARKLGLSYALGPLALIVVGLAAFHSTSDLLATRAALLHSYDARSQLARIGLELATAQSLQRGYLLTGDPTMLKQFNQASGALSSAIATRLQNAPTAQAREAVTRIQSLTSQYVAQLRDEIALRQRSGLKSAAQLTGWNAGQDLLNQLLAELTQAEARTTTSEEGNFAASTRASTTSLEVIEFGTLLTVIALIAIGVVLVRSISQPIEEALNSLASASSEILAGTTQQAAGVQQQAAAVTETVTTVEQISQTSEQSNDRAKAVAQSSHRALETGTAGRKAVEDSLAVMADVKARTESIAGSILSLAERAQAIAEIIAVVTDVAEQTNILALNASIEASRAGEHGRGFGVVAAEIKTLADESKKATVQVRQILGEIQRATNGAVIATEQGTKTVETAMHTVQQADEVIRLLADIIAEAAQAAVQITASAGQQAVGMAQIQRAMRDISESTSQNLASTRQAEAAARDLNTIGSRLSELLRGAPA